MAFIEEPLSFAGDYSAFVDDDRMVAEVRKGNSVVPSAARLLGLTPLAKLRT